MLSDVPSFWTLPWVEGFTRQQDYRSIEAQLLDRSPEVAPLSFLLPSAAFLTQSFEFRQAGAGSAIETGLEILHPLFSSPVTSPGESS